VEGVFEVGADLVEGFVAGEEEGAVEEVGDCEVLEV
jgi:hypothetical protein